MSRSGFAAVGYYLPEIAAVLDAALSAKAGEQVFFSLHIWPGRADGAVDGGHGHMLYVSNARREDVLACMKDAIAKWEAEGPGEPGVPKALTQ